MKKVFILLFLVVLFILLFEFYPNKEKETDEVMSKKYLFYKSELKDRYDTYKLKNPNLSEIDVITRVNLNLDNDFYTNTKLAPNINTNLVLVNKYYYLDKDYVPNNLVELNKNVSGTRFLVDEAASNFYDMCKVMEKDNLKIRVISAYRSYDYQKTLYDNYVLKDGVKLADTYSARPGYSEHQTGLVIDIDNNKSNYMNFDKTDEFKWMVNNSYKYGFILRYPEGKEDITGYSYEAWHYRYVGKGVANFLYENDLTLDEYVARLNNK